MSHIDCYKHELVGMFGNIWVYHPLENIVGDGDEFSCTKAQLVIGGGGGEHPALVLKDPEYAVELFAMLIDEKKEEFDIPDRLTRRFRFKEPERILNFHAWNTETHHRFYLLCTEGSLPNPYDPSSRDSFNVWLIMGFGEFIYYAMPELAPKATKLLKQYQINALHMRFNNILAVPPGMPVYANGGNAFFK